MMMMMMMMMITTLNIVDITSVLDKKQGWCHIIVIVVPHGATRMVKTAKGKVGKIPGFKKESCSAKECNCFRIT